MISRSNNFDFLRFLAAILVLFEHNFPIYFGAQETRFSLYINMPEGNPSFNFGSLGVTVFFIISGYLVSQSWDNLQSTRRFLINRLLRIYPAFIGCVVFLIFLLGPVTTNLMLQSYFSNLWDDIGYYLSALLFLQPFQLPGVFVNNPFPNDINSPFWTLLIELIMYLMIVIVGRIQMLNPQNFWYIVLVFSGFLGWHIYIGEPDNVYIFANAFILGAACYVYRSFFETYDIVGVGSLLVVAAIAYASYYNAINYALAIPLYLIALTYCVVYVAFTPRINFHNFAKFGDFSYGMYIYGFSLQQFLVWGWRDHISFGYFVVLNFITILFFAAVSWHCIEKRCLRLKNQPTTGLS